MTERMAERRTERITERTDRMRKTNRNRKQKAAGDFCPVAWDHSLRRCGRGRDRSRDGNRGFTDDHRRKRPEVEIPETVERAVCVGVGALRYSCYMEAADRIVGVEDYETKPGMDRLYQYVNFDTVQELPVIGANGEPYAEEIIAADPQVIVLSAYASADPEELSRQTGIPWWKSPEAIPHWTIRHTKRSGSWENCTERKIGRRS